jgi:hypothetical protein
MTHIFYEFKLLQLLSNRLVMTLRIASRQIIRNNACGLQRTDLASRRRERSTETGQQIPDPNS